LILIILFVSRSLDRPLFQVFLKKSHHGLRLLVNGLVDLIDLILRQNNRLVGQFLRGLFIIQHLIVEDCQIEGKTKSNGVAWVHLLGGSDFLSLLVGLLCIGKGFSVFLRALIGIGLGDVAVEVTDHLEQIDISFNRTVDPFPTYAHILLSN
jgi:hypothetical protein